MHLVITGDVDTVHLPQTVSQQYLCLLLVALVVPNTIHRL